MQRLEDYRGREELREVMAGMLGAVAAMIPLSELVDYVLAYLWLHGYKVVPIGNAEEDGEHAAVEEIFPRTSAG